MKPQEFTLFSLFLLTVFELCKDHVPCKRRQHTHIYTHAFTQLSCFILFTATYLHYSECKQQNILRGAQYFNFQDSYLISNEFSFAEQG